MNLIKKITFYNKNILTILLSLIISSMNISCLTYNAARRIPREIDRREFYQNQKIIDEKGIILKYLNFDPEAKTILISLHSLPIEKVERVEEIVYGKDIGWWDYAVWGGLYSLFVISPSFSKNLTSSEKTNIAAIVGGAALLDVLGSILFYIPSTKKKIHSEYKEVDTSFDLLQNVNLTITTNEEKFQSNSNDRGELSVPLKFFLKDNFQVSINKPDGLYKPKTIDLASVHTEQNNNLFLVYKMAHRGNFSEAIQSVKKDQNYYLSLPQNHKKQLIGDLKVWFKSQFDSAYSIANNGDFNKAIEEMKKIQTYSPYYQQSQTKISLWTKIVKKKEDKEEFDKAYNIAKAGNFVKAIEEMKKISSKSTYYDQAIKKIDLWDNIVKNNEKKENIKNKNYNSSLDNGRPSRVLSQQEFVSELSEYFKYKGCPGGTEVPPQGEFEPDAVYKKRKQNQKNKCIQENKEFVSKYKHFWIKDLPVSYAGYKTSVAAVIIKLEKPQTNRVHYLVAGMGYAGGSFPDIDASFRFKDSSSIIKTGFANLIKGMPDDGQYLFLTFRMAGGVAEWLKKSLSEGGMGTLHLIKVDDFYNNSYYYAFISDLSVTDKSGNPIFSIRNDYIHKKHEKITIPGYPYHN